MTTSFPNSAICYILADIPGQGEFQGTGVIIGPHTVLTAAHLLYDADTGATADRVSVYPGFAPTAGTQDPPGALAGLQSIHTIKVDDRGDDISAVASQSDFAIIDTSTDLSAYGKFALDPHFTSGDVVAMGYPASANGNLQGTGAFASQDGGLSDIGTSQLALSPGYSGAPLRDNLYRDGQAIPAVAGTVSTGFDAMKLTMPKVDLIRHWIASDKNLYQGGTYAPRGLVPQLAGTVPGSAASSDGSGLAAAVPADFTYAPTLLPAAQPAPIPIAGPAADLAAVLRAGDTGAGAVSFTPVGNMPVLAAAAPVQVFHPNQGFGTDA